MTRLRTTLLTGVLLLAVASNAAAQSAAIGRPKPGVKAQEGIAPVATAVKSTASITASVSTKVPSKPTARARVTKAPVEALLERGANPSGPLAKLSEEQRDSIIDHTRNLLGVRYKWAGINPAKGLDCSGIVKYVFAKLGIELPHRAAELAKLGGGVTRDTSAMQPGDLLVFSKGKRISHVGIYVGEGIMIHASSSSKAVVETPVSKYMSRPAGMLQLRGVRRVFALDSSYVEEPNSVPGQPQQQ